MGVLGKALDKKKKEISDAAARQRMESQLEAPGVSEQTNDYGTIRTIISEPFEASCTDEELMREHGTDPLEWEVYNRIINHWDANAGSGDKITLKQHKIWLRPTAHHLMLGMPEPQPWVPPAPRPLELEVEPKLYMVSSDMQIPFHVPELHDIMCKMAHDLKIDRWYDLGDEFDMSTLSRWQKRVARYRGDGAFDADLITTRDVGKQIFNDRTSAAPDYCLKFVVDSNHLERWDAYILTHAPELVGILPDFREIVGLPALGWKTILSDMGTGTYQMAEVEIAEFLIGIHGYEAKGSKSAGQSVMVELNERAYTSVMQGHCNHQALVSRTVNGPIGPIRQFGVEVGMCGLPSMPYGARKGKDWQPGFAMVTVWPNRTWNIELVPFDAVHKECRYRDNVWRAK